MNEWEYEWVIIWIQEVLLTSRGAILNAGNLAACLLFPTLANRLYWQPKALDYWHNKGNTKTLLEVCEKESPISFQEVGEGEQY